MGVNTFHKVARDAKATVRIKGIVLMYIEIFEEYLELFREDFLMSKEFEHLYGKQAEQFAYVNIPKALYTGEYFRGISFEAKAIYGMMIDSVSLSIKMGGWMKMVKPTYTIEWQTLWVIPAAARIRF